MSEWMDDDDEWERVDYITNGWSGIIIESFWNLSNPITYSLALSLFSNPQNWENDGRYDWMDNSIKKFPDSLPKHVRTANNTLISELLVPAPRQFRETYKEGKK